MTTSEIENIVVTPQNALMQWESTAVVSGTLYRSLQVDDYEVFESHNGEFFLRRLVAECDDVGPLVTLADAEEVLVKFMGMLIAFEEQAWRTIAAQTMSSQLKNVMASLAAEGAVTMTPGSPE